MRPHEGSFAESTSGGLVTVPQKRRHPHASRVLRSNAPTSFFMRTEEQLDQMRSSVISRSIADSTFGVQSLDSTQESEDGSASQDLSSVYDEDETTPLEPRIWEGYNQSLPSAANQRSLYTSSSTESFPTPPLLAQSVALSGPLTPLYLRSPGSRSIESETLSIPKSVSLQSLRLSDDDSSPDDSAFQPVTSSEEEDEGSISHLDVAIPQLVMPSMSIPRRKPFTEQGRSLGKLKILVAGSRGSGKTSLINSIIQSCDDIVHVDSTTASTVDLLGQTTFSAIPLEFKSIKEVYASTRAYPSWWSEIDESRLIRRRRSNNETILERNLCFLDPPGVDGTRSPMGGNVNAVAEYIESLLWRNHSFASFSDGEILSILSGNGGVQVDLVIYLIPGHSSASDFENIKRLSSITNVIPVISKADTIDPDNLSILKSSILNQIRSTDSRPFLFGMSIPELLAESFPTFTSSLPYAISSAKSTDGDNMDASLLMDSTYIPPLAPSELPELISAIFNPDTAAWLRHSSARKFLQWRRTTLPNPRPFLGDATDSQNQSQTISIPQLQASTTTSGSTSSLNSPILSTTHLPSSQNLPTTPSPFAIAHILDHTHREERLIQGRLARWAAQLQRSMENERERYAGLRREERRKWLEERMVECDLEEELEASGHYSEDYGYGDEKKLQTWGGAVEYGRNRRKNPTFLSGVLGQRSLLLVKVLGGCGIIGALALWLMRSFSGEEGSVGGIPVIGGGGAASWGCGPSLAMTDWTQVWSQGWWA